MPAVDVCNKTTMPAFDVCNKATMPGYLSAGMWYAAIGRIQSFGTVVYRYTE